MDIEKYIKHIKDSHEREVMAGKKVCHDGDCGIYKLNIPVCTCGLLHKLLPFVASYYEEAIALYPQYEKDLEEQEVWEFLTQYADEEKLRDILAPMNEKVMDNKEFFDELFKKTFGK